MNARTAHVFGRGLSLLSLLMAALLFPPWFVFLAAGALFFLYDAFIELIFIAFVMDMLYGSPLSRLGNFQFVFSFGALGAYTALNFVKKRMLLQG